MNTIKTKSNRYPYVGIFKVDPHDERDALMCLSDEQLRKTSAADGITWYWTIGDFRKAGTLQEEWPIGPFKTKKAAIANANLILSPGKIAAFTQSRAHVQVLQDYFGDN